MTLRRRLLLLSTIPAGVAAGVAAWIGSGDGAIAWLAGAIVGAVTSLMLWRRTSVSLVELSRVAHAVMQGDLSRRPPLADVGELGHLNSAFRALIEEVLAHRRALGAEQAMLATVTASTTEGLLVLDARRQVLWINEAARRLLQIATPTPFPADVLPRTPRLWDLISASLEGSPSELTELEIGGRVVAVSARPLTSNAADGPLPRSVVLGIFDLTRIRRLESMRRDFVANVSHELKTPLTAIRGFAETLRDDELPPDLRRQFAQTVYANAERMHRLVEELLDLSRIETGGWRPQLTLVAVEAVVHDVFAGMRERATARQVSLEVAPAPDAANLVADATAMRQILGNLVENALRHTTAGRIEVRTARVAGGVQVQVHDTGAGIQPEHLPRIFERFYRVDEGRARDAGGTGLGLSIVKHLVEAHGGTVRVASTVGSGTTMSLFFPDPAPDRVEMADGGGGPRSPSL